MQNTNIQLDRILYFQFKIGIYSRSKGVLLATALSGDKYKQIVMTSQKANQIQITEVQMSLQNQWIHKHIS